MKVRLLVRVGEGVKARVVEPREIVDVNPIEVILTF